MNKTAIIMLCEVALGNMNELTTTDFNADNLPKGKHSTKGCGITFPDESQSVFLDYLEIPKGKHKKDKETKVKFLIYLIHRHIFHIMNTLFTILIK